MNGAPAEPTVRAVALSLIRRAGTVSSEVERVRGMDVPPAALRAVERVAEAFARASEVAGSVLLELEGSRGRPPHERDRLAAEQYERIRALVPEIERARKLSVAIGAAAALGAFRTEEAGQGTRRL